MGKPKVVATQTPYAKKMDALSRRIFPNYPQGLSQEGLKPGLHFEELPVEQNERNQHQVLPAASHVPLHLRSAAQLRTLPRRAQGLQRGDGSTQETPRQGGDTICDSSPSFKASGKPSRARISPDPRPSCLLLLSAHSKAAILPFLAVLSCMRV